MPRSPIDEALKRRAAQHGFERGSKEYRAYVYGTQELLAKNAKPQEDAGGKQPE